MQFFARDDEVDVCDNNNEYDGRDSLRILAVFMILISSGLGAFFPILSSRYSVIRLPAWCFFIAKFFGSGVIVATGFIHLLEPATDNLGNTCLGGTFADYPWAFGICLMSLFALFFSEIITHHFFIKANGNSDHTNSHSHFGEPNHKTHQQFPDESEKKDDEEEADVECTAEYIPLKVEYFKDDEELGCSASQGVSRKTDRKPFVSVPGKDHFSHEQDHQDLSQLGTLVQQKEREQYLSQVFAVFILEFGVVFHSVFVGLSLAVAGDEFNTLFIVLVFHQMFEGLGLGTRIAETTWPASKRYTPWLLGLGYTLSTPIAIAIGIGVRHSFAPGSKKALITNGVFDSISAGILIYTGLVELMAHEFLYSQQFKGEGGCRRMIGAYFIMCLGAGLMALLGRWA